MRHDRGLEEPPEHPEDCGCRECRVTCEEIGCRFPAGCDCTECREWDHDEELNAEDLEDRLEAAWERVDERSERQGDLIAMFRREV